MIMILPYTQIVDCKAPGVPSNGTLESYFQTSEGSVVIYKCVHGLFPRERFKSVCTPAGTWEPDPTQLMCRDPGNSWLMITIICMNEAEFDYHYFIGCS